MPDPIRRVRRLVAAVADKHPQPNCLPHQL
jgi:hypothetical protein